MTSIQLQWLLCLVLTAMGSYKQYKDVRMKMVHFTKSSLYVSNCLFLNNFRKINRTVEVNARPGSRTKCLDGRLDKKNPHITAKELQKM